MKIGIFNSYVDLSVPNKNQISRYEMIVLKKILERYFKADVDLIGSTNTNFSKLDVNKYDKVILCNSASNYYGGIIPENVKNTYKALNKYKKTIYFYFIDTVLSFTQLYVRLKKMGIENYDEFKIKNKIKILSFHKDLDFVTNVIHKNIKNVESVYVPLEQWRLFEKDYTLSLIDTIDRQIDLIYGGSNRSGRRKAKLSEFYMGHKNLNVTIFGTIKENKFNKDEIKNVRFLKKVSPPEVIHMTSKAFATCIIGDTAYSKGNVITIRIFEAILAKTICFIDIDFDIDKQIFKNNEILKNFLYVKSKSELNKKIQWLKKYPNKHKKLIELQLEWIEKLKNEGKYLKLLKKELDL